jgi:glutathione S-transferase
MSTIRLIHMYASPWSERVRWAFTFKGVPYEKLDYRPGVDEEQVKTLTGQAQVPVMQTNGTVIPDSTAILNWLEEYKPQPALMPKSQKDRAQVILWEELMDGVLGPQARVLVIGRLLQSGESELQQAGLFFAQKYQHSPYAESHARIIVKRILTGLKYALDGREYLVGSAFTRADLVSACMLMLMKPAPDDLFLFPAVMRQMFTEPTALDSELTPIYEWRDEMYRKHRGEAVKP